MFNYKYYTLCYITTIFLPHIPPQHDENSYDVSKHDHLFFEMKNVAMQVFRVSTALMKPFTLNRDNVILLRSPTAIMNDEWKMRKFQKKNLFFKSFFLSFFHSQHVNHLLLSFMFWLITQALNFPISTREACEAIAVHIVVSYNKSLLVLLHVFRSYFTSSYRMPPPLLKSVVWKTFRRELIMKAYNDYSIPCNPHRKKNGNKAQIHDLKVIQLSREA